MLKLNTIRSQPGARKSRKRLGRGPGSGNGTTAGKGTKGQRARSGVTFRAGFEGGQTPLYRRVPKRGFKSPNVVIRRETRTFNVSDLERWDHSSLPEVSLETLKKSGKIKGQAARLSILGMGELSKAFQVKAHKVSKSAEEKIKKAGGSVEIITFGHYSRTQKATAKGAQ